MAMAELDKVSQPDDSAVEDVILTGPVDLSEAFLGPIQPQAILARSVAADTTHGPRLFYRGRHRSK